MTLRRTWDTGNPLAYAVHQTREEEKSPHAAG